MHSYSSFILYLCRKFLVCIMKYTLLAIVILLSLSNVAAQELKCNVTFNTSKISGTNKQVFETLRKAVDDFMNQRQWTNLKYQPNERIDCSMTFIVSSYTDNVMRCELLVQSRRPVYGTTYSTPMLNLRDKEVVFSYAEFDQLELTNSYENNLTAVLAYYAYIMLGYDMDSYARLCGTPMFQLAENIVNMSQSRTDEGAVGWKAFESNRNRYALISCLVGERYRNMRAFSYTYHRLALDKMVTNVDKARARIAEGLNIVRETNKTDPNGYAIQIFIDSKSDELVNMFKKGTTEEKNNVYDHMTAINPTGTDIYNKIKE